jgi:CubicO group peptidase (beta-lactamase class C family)
MKQKLIFVILFFPLLGACQTKQPGYSLAEIGNYSYKIPIRLADGWETAKPGPQAISLVKLEDGVKAIMRGEYPHIHSILIACQGKLIFEEYFPGYAYKGEWTDFNHATPHGLQSVTKSLTSLVFGIAFDQGYIENIDSSILNWYPEYDGSDRAEKKAITIRHLLSMQSGLEWNEWSRSYSSRFNDLNRFYRSKEPIDFVLKKKLVDEPGTNFSYNSACTSLLGDIIYRSTGQYFDEYAEQYFFKLLGINNIQWESILPNMITTAGGLKLRPRDLLKIGYLILQNGIWEDKQIISEEWLKQVFYPSAFTDESWDYGFQWVLPRIIHPRTQKVLESYLAGGFGGQYLIVYPEQNCIVVMTGGSYKSEDSSAAWHDDYFLPALMVKDE